MKLYREGYRLVFEENFDGGLEKNKWTAITEKVPSHSAKKHDLEPTHVITYSADKHEGAEMNYLPENLSVKDGHLVLSADRYGEGFMGAKATCEGMVFARGYVEVEALLPEFQKGVWPVFSIKSLDGVTYKTEFEILAIHGDKAKNACNIYLKYTDPVYEIPHSLNLMYGQKHRFYPDQESDEVLAPGYHTFGFEWFEDYIVFYCDGVEYNRIDVCPSPYRIFGEKQLAKFNIGLSIGLPNIDPPEDDAKLPAEFKIRSIKLYQCDGDMLVKR